MGYPTVIIIAVTGNDHIVVPYGKEVYEKLIAWFCEYEAGTFKINYTKTDMSEETVELNICRKAITHIKLELPRPAKN